MTNEEILKIAMRQSAVDLSCNEDDFLKHENVIVISSSNTNARKYLELPFICNLVSYGNNIVASIDYKYKAIVRDYIQRYKTENCFETPDMHVLNDAFEKYGFRVCIMSEYFLPDVNKMKPLNCPYPMRLMKQEDFAGLYLSEWSNALCKERKELDVLGIGAYDEGKLVGFAACSADCDTMWQIGVDVLPEYRRFGIASALTSRLAIEIMERDKVPFYCCAWSNVKSARNAIRSGFTPAWVELTVKKRELVDNI